MIKDMMKKTGSGKYTSVILLMIVSLSIIFCAKSLYAGKFLSSAHGNSVNGVKRSAVGFPTDYPQGHCTHCHEQHAKIGGAEPAPTGGPDNYLLFNTMFTSQTDNFCLDCHKGAGSYQTGGYITNRSYSYRAGNWPDSLDDIKEAFSFSSPGTSHNLEDIRTFIVGKPWGYTSNSNPCNACHNPHAAQGDPIGAPNSAKSSGTRGWPVSLPHLHSTDNNAWGLWGDESGEKMIDYTGTGYQPPYRYSSSFYEPDGSSTLYGSNLTDYVTFCTDCHNITNDIYSTTLSRNLYKFNWSIDKHGGAAAVDDGDGTYPITDVVGPYQESSLGTYVLACTDCHEPHGSSNKFLIREGVNGGSSTTSVTILTTPDNTKDWKSLCENCHDGSSIVNAHHIVWNALWPGDYNKCSYCHEPEASDFRNCLLCHYHGNSTIPAVPDYSLPAYSYGEKLF